MSFEVDLIAAQTRDKSVVLQAYFHCVYILLVPSTDYKVVSVHLKLN